MSDEYAEFRVRRSEKVAVLSVSGEVDLAVAGPFEQARKEALDSGLAVVIDLDECEFIDSSGIAGIIQTFNRATDAGQRFALAGSGPQVRRVLDLSGISRLLPYFPSVEDAVGHVR